MIFKWKLCDLLLLDSKENTNLYPVDVAFSTLINYFRKIFEILGVTFRHALAKTTTERCLLEKADPKV